MPNIPDLNTCLDILLGVSIGDALGVPVEFKSREQLRKNKVFDMNAFGSHNQPAGTFSDDSSLTFCLAEAIASGFELKKTGDNFIKWRYDNYWTATNEVFDVGMTTERAIQRLAKGVRPDLAGDFEDYHNGNGSLMRVLPLLVYIFDKPVNDRYKITREVSSITHGHIRSSIACFYYLEFAMSIVKGMDKFEIYESLQTIIPKFLDSISINADEKNMFKRLLIDQIYMIEEEKIWSSGYVVHTLEASIWCLLNTNNYKEAVLKAINLGEDTDTTGAVTGGLAALLYGHNTIPGNWINQLAKKTDIENLALRMSLAKNEYLQSPHKMTIK